MSKTESQNGVPVTRRNLLIAFGAGVLVGHPLAALPELPVMPPPGRTSFEVVRGGVVIGHHRVDITDRQRQREVRTAADIHVSVVGVSLYLFKQQTLEVWSGGRLISFESETTEDDFSTWVKGRATAEGFDVENRKERHSAPADIMVATYWRPEICRQSRLIDPKKGRVREQSLLSTRQVTVAEGNAQVTADEYRVRGILDGACLYDQRGSWIGAWFDKQGRIEYREMS